jgi:ribosomal protein S18 acetylase RimI-like enzyme
VAHRLTRSQPAIALRPAVDEDRAFLLAVYASTRSDEMSAVPWSDAAKADFVQMQFAAQDAYYRATYADGQFLVVERDGTPIGRLYHSRLIDEIRVIDICLLPEYRGLGIGSRLLADLLAEADRDGLMVRLHVESWNPAMRLYERLGFRAVGEASVYQLMERAPS